jgi:hypothetical protein
MRVMKLLPAVALVVITPMLAMAQSKDDDSQARAALEAKGFQPRGGLVNAVQGEGQCICSGKLAGLRPRESLVAGDTIQTTSGRAEILLNPGYYLRLSNNTVAQFLDLSPDNLKIQILNGSMIIEIAEDATPLPWRREINERLFNGVTVITPHTEYMVFRAGAYRFDVSEVSSVRAVKGAVAIAGGILKEGKTASFAAGQITVTSNRVTGDAFDEWSQARANNLVQSNHSLKHTDWYKQMRDGRAYLDASGDLGVAGAGRLVSARNGEVGFVENGAAIKNGSTDWRALKSGTELSNSDRVRTTIHSRAEIHPYPDFYLFLESNTELVYSVERDTTASINVARGSVVLVVHQSSSKVLAANVLKLSTGNAAYEITNAGYYHLNVTPDKSEMLVYEGTVRTKGGNIGATKRIVTAGLNTSESSLQKDARDSFDLWSDFRAANQGGSSMLRLWYSGLWFFDPAIKEYTFVPGGRECKSPYGGSYSTMYQLTRPAFSARPPDPDLLNGIRSSSPRPNP